MEKSLEVGDMKEGGKCLWNKSLPDGPTWHVLTHHENYWKLSLSFCLCFFSPFFSCISIFLPGTHLGLCVVLVFNLCTSCQTFSLVCLCALCDTVQSGERPPRQHVAGHGQTVLGNQGWSLAVVKAVRPACLCESNIILLGVLGVRHILLHSPPPPLLVLQTDNSLSYPFIFPLFPICKKLFHKHTLSTPHRILDFF